MVNQLVDVKPISLVALEPLVRTNATCVSIYLPAYQQGSGTPRSDVLLRSLTAVAKTRLNVLGVSDIDIEDLLQPVLALSREEGLHRGHLQSVAIFRAPNRLESFLLPGPVKESVHVGPAFHLMPALELLAVPPEFWVLALTRKGVRLLHGDSHGIATAPLPPSIPATLDEFLSFQAPDHRLANRVSAGPSSGSMKGIVFGTGGDAEAHNAYFRDYCLTIDRGLRTLTGVKPLVVMGAVLEVNIFNSISAHSYLTTPILRSPDDGGLTDEQVLMRVRGILAQEASPAESRACEAAENSLGGGLALADLGAILGAAHKGRVDTLFLCAGTSQLGDANHITGRVPLSGELAGCDEDLYNAAAIETLRHSGHVWVVPQERMPGGGLSLARLRY